MSEQNVKNEPGVGRIISKQITSIDRATPNIIAFESRLITIEQQVNNIDLASKLDVADFNGTNILAELITVDGTGSGLDADLLDGHEASFFAPSIHDHDARYYERSAADAAFLGINDTADNSNLFDGHGISYFALQASTYTKNEVDNLIDNSGFTESFGNNGWVIMPNGLILQWGVVVSTIDSTQTFNFPRIFTNACFQVQLTRRVPNAGIPISVNSFSTTSFTINRGDNIDGSQSIVYFAIGH